MSNNKSTLVVTHVSEERESSDGRNYKVASFAPAPDENGVMSNARPSGRTIWNEGPNGSVGDPIYPFLKVGLKVRGSLETVETEPYYIKSPTGKEEHPETGEPANKATTWSSIVFERETIEGLARNQKNITLKESSSEQTLATASAEQEQEQNEPAEMSIT